MFGYASEGTRRGAGWTEGKTRMADQQAGDAAAFALIVTEAGELQIELGNAFSDRDIAALTQASWAVTRVLEPVTLLNHS